MNDSKQRKKGELKGSGVVLSLRGGIGEAAATEPLRDNFLTCVRARNRETFSTPELGAAAFTTVAMGVRS